MLTIPRYSIISLGSRCSLARLGDADGAAICDPMDLLWHINLEEMLSDLTVATFLILLAVSVVVVGSMVMFSLIDLAFEKVEPTIRHHDDLTANDASWQAGRPWLFLRSNFLPQRALPHSQQMSERGVVRSFT